jgi:hypothetical protein
LLAFLPKEVLAKLLGENPHALFWDRIFRPEIFTFKNSFCPAGVYNHCNLNGKILRQGF